MSVSRTHLLHQLPVLKALGQTVMASLVTKGGKLPSNLPGPQVRKTLPARADSLIDDYIVHVGGLLGPYQEHVPAHLFPQWSFPLLTEAMRGLPFPMAKILNAGCSMKVNAPLPRRQDLVVSACLDNVDATDYRVILRSKIITGTREIPNCIEVTQTALIPIKRDKSKSKTKKAPVVVPEDAQELCRQQIPMNAGRDFALLTGDINPLHWVKPYAKMMGHPTPILHGFSTMARAAEAVVQGPLNGDAESLKQLEVRFAAPMRLAADIGIYIHENELFVGDKPGAKAYLTGSYSSKLTDLFAFVALATSED